MELSGCLGIVAGFGGGLLTGCDALTADGGGALAADGSGTLVAGTSGALAVDDGALAGARAALFNGGGMEG